jgi:hypothetical protein
LVEVHIAPATQSTQLPETQTRSVEHMVPSTTTIPVSVHTGAPVLHEIVPV